LFAFLPACCCQVKANWQAVPALQAMPVQSAILQPKPGQTLKPNATGCITAAGYAWSGGGHNIIRVEVSADAGKNLGFSAAAKPWWDSAA
jgi:hypothetical protein